MMQRNDADSPWKTILRLYFQESIEFFFPKIAQQIDWQHPPEFLDKEFQQIAGDAAIGKRYADQLVKVHRKRGKPLFLLLHLEVQAHKEKNFPERMFIYALRIFDRFHQSATSLVMAHLKTQATRKNAQSRKEWKFWLIRRLYEQGYNRNQVIDLFKFIDWVMVLPKPLEEAFWTEVRTYEEEQKVPYITSVERIGFDRGIEEGRQETTLELANRLLNRRFGVLPQPIVTQIHSLSIEQLKLLAEELLDLRTIEDLTQYLTTL